MKKLTKAFAAATLAASFVVVSATSSEAATVGGKITNMGDVNYAPATWIQYTFDTTPDANSSFGYLYYGVTAGPSVQAFRFRNGCVGKSQYSGSAWPYSGTVIYKMSANYLDLQLRMKCN